MSIMKNIACSAVVLAALALSGCASYTWRSSVPAEMRTVSVPTFLNESEVTELGSVVTRQVLREFQREGTMRIAPQGRSAIEVQGVVKTSGSSLVAYERKTGTRNREHVLKVTALVSFIDKKAGKVVVNDRKYSASASFVAYDDILTAERDASGRIAEELARQIVDDVLSQNWGGDEAGKDSGKEQ